MKYMKRSGIYQCSNYNCTFNPKTIEAYSYKWWKFVAKIEGVVVFNNYRYSVTTAKHQSKVRSLLSDLGIKVDIFAPFPRGINTQSLEIAIREAEENLCDAFLAGELKRQERNDRARARRVAKKLENYLENQKHFRDYEIRSVKSFGYYNTVAVHQLVDGESLEHDADKAVESFLKDGFSKIIFYVEGI